jgi:hypothetical protein
MKLQIFILIAFVAVLAAAVPVAENQDNHTGSDNKDPVAENQDNHPDVGASGDPSASDYYYEYYDGCQYYYEYYEDFSSGSSGPSAMIP